MAEMRLLQGPLRGFEQYAVFSNQAFAMQSVNLPVYRVVSLNASIAIAAGNSVAAEPHDRFCTCLDMPALQKWIGH